MKPEDSFETLTEDRSTPAQEWSAEAWWAEKTKPSRQRNMTQSQRDSLAFRYRQYRRARSLETL